MRTGLIGYEKQVLPLRYSMPYWEWSETECFLYETLPYVQENEVLKKAPLFRASSAIYNYQQWAMSS